jgi:hypothetical protein
MRANKIFGGLRNKRLVAGISIPYTEDEEAWVETYTSYTPVFTGFSVSPTVEARYFNYSGMVHLWMTTTTNGTSNATTFTFTLPIAAVSSTSQNCIVSAVTNGGNLQSLPGIVVITSGSTTATCYVNTGLAVWNASGTKAINLSILYEASGYTAWSPTFGGFSVSPTVVARYNNSTPYFTHLWITATAHGTSNASGAATLTFTLPVTSANNGITQYIPCTRITNNGSAQNTPGLIVIPPNSNTAIVYRDSQLTTVWTASGNKSFGCSITYESAT